MLSSTRASSIRVVEDGSDNYLQIEMFRRVQKGVTIINAATTNGFSGMFDVSDFRNCLLAMHFSSSPAMTVKVAGGIGTKVVCGWLPANSPASNSGPNNLWSFVQIKNMKSGTTYAGNSGTQVNAGGTALFQVDVNALDWLSVFITSRTAGTITVKGTFATNV